MGFYQVMHGFDFNRVLIGLASLGAAAGLVGRDDALRQGTLGLRPPIVQFEGASFPIAEAATLIEAGRLLCYRGLARRSGRASH